MRPTTLVLATLALATAAIPAFAAAAEDDPYGTGNGFVIMIHGHYDGVLADVPAGAYPRPIEAFTATRDGDAYELAVIPFATWTERPEQVWETTLVVTTQDGRQLVLEPLEGFGQSREVCGIETSLPGHEGELDACDVFRIPASEVPLGGAVTLEYRFRYMEQLLSEPYSAVSHALIHAALEGEGATLDDADQHDEPTPFLLQG